MKKIIITTVCFTSMIISCHPLFAQKESDYKPTKIHLGLNVSYFDQFDHFQSDSIRKELNKKPFKIGITSSISYISGKSLFSFSYRVLNTSFRTDSISLNYKLSNYFIDYGYKFYLNQKNYISFSFGLGMYEENYEKIVERQRFQAYSKMGFNFPVSISISHELNSFEIINISLLSDHLRFKPTSMNYDLKYRNGISVGVTFIVNLNYLFSRKK